MKAILILFWLLFSFFASEGQDSLAVRHIQDLYAKSCDQLEGMLEKSESKSFKKAVFIVENTFLGNSLDTAAFNMKIQQMSMLVKAWASANKFTNYRYSDSVNLKINHGIYTLMKDSITLIASDNSQPLTTIPFSYDFEDYSGRTDFTKMFVSKLLYTYSGNCHSMPYLYKILADELGASCWISLAPNHLYIKNRCKKIGWYNTELTSGEFPIDAWITTSGYVPVKAVQNGIYMDTLSNQQAIALCVLDLAKGYEFQTHNYEDGFILKCCDLVLQYHSVNVQALLLKAETLKRMYERMEDKKSIEAKNIYGKMEHIYITLFDLGYREMPEGMYMQWLLSVNKQREKYSNKKLKEALQGKKK